MQYRHTHQRATTRLLNFSEGQGSIQRIFMPRYLSEDVGLLFEHLKEALFMAKLPIIRSVNFTLVNFCSRSSLFSYGFCPPPPEHLIYNATSFALTFAMTRYNLYDINTKFNPQFKKRFPLYSFLWGPSLNTRSDYYTISILLPDALDIKLRPMMTTNCSYFYNVLSTLTKNYVRNVYTSPFLDNMFHNYNQFYNMPFINLIRRLTWKHLPYNKFVWQHATNLLTQVVDYNVTLFYFLYVSGDVPVQQRTEGDLLQQILFGEGRSILSNLKQSIVEYNTDRTSENLILMAALFGKANNGDGYYTKLKELHYSTNIIVSEDDAQNIMLETFKIGES